MLQSTHGLSQAAAKSKLVLEQATASLQAGDRGEAEWLLRKHILEQPKDAAVLTKLAELAMEASQVEEATMLLRRAAAAEPTPEQRLILLRHLQHYVGAEQALEEIETLPQGLRGSFDVLSIEAAVRGFLRQFDRQIEIYQQISRADPGNAAVWKTLGDALKTVGRADDAVAALRRAIDVRPTYGEAYWTLANFKSFWFTDGDISAMRKALRSKLNDEDALHFHFALGEAYEARKSFAKSFQHYEAGNAIRRKGLPPEALRVTEFVLRATNALQPEVFDHFHGAGAEASDPIFVVGLHRSGSTLIEQILASHPLIEGTAELTIMQQIWDRIGRLGALHGRGPFQELLLQTKTEIRRMGEEYVERTRAYRSTERPYFVDKLPANWMNIGLIRLALPNAKIIDARRHPMACGFSNFKQNYASGVTFSYSLESIGHFYRDYVSFMEHIDRVQPGTVHRVINERLIDDTEGEVRRMLEFVGVPFDTACLDFHRTKRAVQTPSAEQVRRPINREGVDYWRHFEPWLGPLQEALGPALKSWDTPKASHKR
jgi:tetratricopeptide (TPR) repeat protein